MRDAPRHVRPGRRPLGHGEFGDIVEGQDHAEIGFVVFFAGHSHGIVALAGLAYDRDLALHRLDPRLPARLVDHFAKFRDRGFERLADKPLIIQTKELARRAVGQRDAACGINADHAGGHARKHRLDEAPPFVEFGVLGHDVVALRLQVDGHLFERRTEAADVVARKPVGELNVQIALAHLLGGADELADRHDEPVCEDEPGPDRRCEKRQSQQHIHDREDKLILSARLFELRKLHNVELRALQKPENVGIDRAQGVEVGVVDANELFQSRDAIREIPAHRHDPAFGGARYISERRSAIGRAFRCSREKIAFRVDDEGGGHGTQRDGCRKEAVERRLVLLVEGGLLFHLAADAHDIGANRLPALLHLGLRNLDRVADDALHPRGEERVEGAIDGDGCENRKKNGRKKSDKAEDPGDAKVQASARLPLPRLQKLGDLKADDPDDRDDEGGVDAERPEHDVVCRDDDRGQSVQDQKGRDTR